ncbi:MAG: O-antigen ligase family protein [Limnochordales bacterium]|nr:O-antigen ligase family protein [Limnochordales bacterium]
MDTGGLESRLEQWGWWLYFAGVPFSGWSSPGILVLLAAAVKRHRHRHRHLERGPDRATSWDIWYYRAVLLMIASYVASWIPAVSKLDAIGTTVGFAVALFIGLSISRHPEYLTRDWIRTHLWPLSLSAGLHAAVAICFYLQTGTRTAGMTGNPNHLGTLMLVAFWLGGIYFASVSGRRRLWVIPYEFLILLGLLSSESRGAWVGLVAGGVAFLVLAARSVSWSRLRKPLVTGTVSLLLALPVVGMVAPEQRLMERVQTIFDLDANQDRLTVYETSWNAFLDNPIAGIGLNNLKWRYEEYRPAGASGTQGIAHNLELQALAETGILGGLAMLLLVGVWLIRGFPSRLANPPRMLAYSLLVAMIVRDQFDGALLNWNEAVLVCGLAGALLAAESADAPAG